MSTATAETKAEKMGLDDHAKVSELKDLGWTVEIKGKEHFAHEKAGDLRTVGPASSVKALYTQVKLAVGTPQAADEDDSDETEGRKPRTHKVKGDGGQSLLPGTENAVLEDMRKAILDYRATTMEILDMQKRQKEEKKLVMQLMHKFENELQIDPETGFKYFQVERVIAELEVETKEDLKTRVVTN